MHNFCALEVGSDRALPAANSIDKFIDCVFIKVLGAIATPTNLKMFWPLFRTMNIALRAIHAFKSQKSKVIPD
ncbi:MAG: hypothetical protein AAGJ08_04280 [Cyanobacteria bacterium P01_H01_bin.35]